MKEQKDNLFDINKMPHQPGLLVFGISMSNISTSQTAKKCFKYVENFIEKIYSPQVGLVQIYSDSLYFYSEEKAPILKQRYQNLINSHKNEFLKLLKKHPWLIPSAYSFMTWSQVILESREFFDYFGRLKNIYKKDKTFQQYLKEDLKKVGKKPTKSNIYFILEELLVLHFISKGKIKLNNGYVNGREKWVLNCYPGKPMKSEIYFYKKNFFNLHNKENIYQNSFYDLEGRKLYNYDKITLLK
jgi:hypothetical protein